MNFFLIKDNKPGRFRYDKESEEEDEDDEEDYNNYLTNNDDDDDEKKDEEENESEDARELTVDGPAQARKRRDVAQKCPLYSDQELAYICMFVRLPRLNSANNFSILQNGRFSSFRQHARSVVQSVRTPRLSGAQNFSFL